MESVVERDASSHMNGHLSRHNDSGNCSVFHSPTVFGGFGRVKTPAYGLEWPKEDPCVWTYVSNSGCLRNTDKSNIFHLFQGKLDRGSPIQKWPALLGMSP